MSSVVSILLTLICGRSFCGQSWQLVTSVTTGIALHCSATVFCCSFSFRLLVQLAGLKSVSLMWHNYILCGSRRTVFYGMATLFLFLYVSLWLVFLWHHSVTGLSLTSFSDWSFFDIIQWLVFLWHQSMTGLSLTSFDNWSFFDISRWSVFRWCRSPTVLFLVSVDVSQRPVMTQRLIDHFCCASFSSSACYDTATFFRSEPPDIGRGYQ